MDIDQNLLQDLIEKNSRFRMLYEEHSLFEKQLIEYERKSILSPQEELEMADVKKLKLAGRDEMERIVQTVDV
jgi:uncharacterized protein YdcH (DUF465 family)